MTAPSKPARPAGQDGADGRQLRLLGVQIGDDRLHTEGHPPGIPQIAGQGVVTLPLKGGEGAARRTGRLGPQLRGLGQRPVLEQGAQLLSPGCGQGPLGHTPAGQQHLG